jgi:prephenate dehydrogenase
MGSWLARLFERRGFEVFKMGRDTLQGAQDVVPICDVVALSVPISDTVEVIRRIGPHVRGDALFMDLTSVKSEPVKAMVAHSTCEVVGAHPLFGPGDLEVTSRRVVLCPGRGERGLKWLEKLFKEEGLDVVILDPDAHDLFMGLVQGVNHFATMVLAICASQSGLSPRELERFSTPDFMKRIKRMKDMFSQPSELFQSLLMENRHALAMIVNYCEKARLLATMAAAKDRAAFDSMWRDVKEFFLREVGDGNERDMGEG